MNEGNLSGFLLAISARGMKEAVRESGLNGMTRAVFWDGAAKAVEKLVDVATGEDPKDAIESLAAHIDKLIAEVDASNDSD